MKKLFILLAVASLGFVSCNNESSNDVDAEKAKADSIRIADSLNKVKADADAAAAEMEKKRVADSTRIADSIKAATKK